MDLRKPHAHPLGFDTFLLALAVFGVVIAGVSFTRGGPWYLLGYTALIGELLLIYSAWIEPRRLVVKIYREALQPKPQVWIKLIFLSDLHAGGFHPVTWYARIARQVERLQPDLIILGGDYVTDRYEPIVELKPLADLSAPLGKYFVLGNHDLVDWPHKLRETLVSFGYVDLTNRLVLLKHHNRVCELYGVDDTWYGHPQWMARASSTLPHLTISHEPDFMLDMSPGQTDLVLSGHTHGGQVCLPLLGALWPIPCKLGRKLYRGRTVVNGVPCVISNGLGETDGRLRLFSAPQIVVVYVGI